MRCSEPGVSVAVAIHASWGRVAEPGSFGSMSFMSSHQPFLLSVAERGAAFLILLAWAPVLFFIAMFLQALTKEAVIIPDAFPNADGEQIRYYRFRTRGDEILSRCGRLLRRFRLDEYLLYWSVVCGNVRLEEVIRYLRGI